MLALNHFITNIANIIIWLNQIDSLSGRFVDIGTAAL